MSRHTPRHSSSADRPQRSGARTRRAAGVVVALTGLVVASAAAASAMNPRGDEYAHSSAGQSERRPDPRPRPSMPTPTKPTFTAPTTAPTTTPRPTPTPPTTTTPRPTTPTPTTPPPPPPTPTPTPPPPPPAPPAPGNQRILLGSAGDVETLRRQTGVNLAQHTYTYFSNGVPNARMITVNTPGTWAQVAATRPGSALHNDILRWGRTLDARPTTTLIAFQHEPEMSQNTSKGSPADFVAAYRNVVSIMRSSGVDNVKFTWQMTAWAFRAPAGSRQSVEQWYPGDAYVDYVGADAYNWSACGEGRGRWVSLQQLTDPVLAFAGRHGKQTVLAEWASTSHPLRVSWLDQAHDYFVANRSKLAAVFYFNRPPTHAENGDCRWTLTQESEFEEYRQMARDTRNFTL